MWIVCVGCSNREDPPRMSSCRSWLCGCTLPPQTCGFIRLALSVRQVLACSPTRTTRASRMMEPEPATWCHARIRSDFRLRSSWNSDQSVFVEAQPRLTCESRNRHFSRSSITLLHRCWNVRNPHPCAHMSKERLGTCPAQPASQVKPSDITEGFFFNFILFSEK